MSVSASTPAGHVEVTDCTSAPAAPPVFWWPADRPHPAWCDNLHEDADRAGDRMCSAGVDRIALKLAEPLVDRQGDFCCPDYLSVDLRQHVADQTAQVWVGVNDSREGRWLTPSEARELAAALLAAVGAAEGGCPR